MLTTTIQHIYIYLILFILNYIILTYLDKRRAYRRGVAKAKREHEENLRLNLEKSIGKSGQFWKAVKQGGLSSTWWKF